MPRMHFEDQTRKVKAYINEKTKKREKIILPIENTRNTYLPLISAPTLISDSNIHNFRFNGSIQSNQFGNILFQ